MNELTLQQLTLPPDIFLADALEVYRLRISILKRGYEQERYRLAQISKSFLGAIVVRNITSVDIARYRDTRLLTPNPKTQKPISNSTVRLEMSLLSNFFEVGRIEWGICDSNPVNNVRKPKTPPGRDRRLTAREERQILRYAHGHANIDLYSIIVIALESAMRQGEILGLRWEHVNLKRRIVHLPETKNGTKRDVPLSVRARDAITRLGVKPRGRVFGYSSNGMKSTWRVLIQRLKIEDLHFHDLRHEAVSRLFELGTLDMMEISAISGHKSLSMLKRYTHLKAQRLVRKLEGHKTKGRQLLFDHLIPYPAQVCPHAEGVKIRLLDFEVAPVLAPDLESAICLAQDRLMRTLLTSLKFARDIPPPDQYLDWVEEDTVIMIDPLPADDYGLDLLGFNTLLE